MAKLYHISASKTVKVPSWPIWNPFVSLADSKGDDGRESFEERQELSTCTHTSELRGGGCDHFFPRIEVQQTQFGFSNCLQK